MIENIQVQLPELDIIQADHDKYDAEWETRWDGYPIDAICAQLYCRERQLLQQRIIANKSYAEMCEQVKINNSLRFKIAQIENEIESVISHIPERFQVRVREGAGAENLTASLAVSAAKLVSALSESNTLKWEPINEAGTMCPPDPELVDAVLAVNINEGPVCGCKCGHPTAQHVFIPGAAPGGFGECMACEECSQFQLHIEMEEP